MEICRERYGSAAAQGLARALEAELLARYESRGGAGGPYEGDDRSVCFEKRL